MEKALWCRKNYGLLKVLVQTEGYILNVSGAYEGRPEEALTMNPSMILKSFIQYFLINY